MLFIYSDCFFTIALITKTCLIIILKILPPKMKILREENSAIFHISAQNIDCGYSLENPQSMFLSRNKKNNLYPCKPPFYYIKVGVNGVKII